MSSQLRPEPGPPGLLANLRWRARVINRRRLLALAALLAAALVVGWSVQTARTTAAELGRRRPVLVVNQPLTAGDELIDAVSVEAVPVAMTPSDAVSAIAELPPGAVATADLAAGEVLRLGRTSAAGRFGLQPNQRAVTVPLPLAPGPLEPGQRVELIGISALGDGGPIAAETLATDVRVIAVGEDGLTVAVDRSLADDIYRTAAVGVVEVAIRSG